MDIESFLPLNYLRRMWQLRYFWLSLVANDLRIRYRRSFLGIGWSLARPLGMTLVFCLVFGQLFHLPVAEYAPFVLVGMTVWQYFSESLRHGCICFCQAAAYIRQQPLPLAIFPLRTVLGTGFHGLVALGLALAAVAWFRGLPPAPLLASLLPAVVLLFLLGWFLATLCGILHTHFHDTQHLLDIGLQVLFYLTPVLYPRRDLVERMHWGWLIECNPLTAFLELIRAPLLDGVPPQPHHWQVAVGCVLLAGMTAWMALRRWERTLVFWI